MARTNTATFTFTNTHPKGIVTLSDCVYRAISIATGKTWLEVYDELTDLGRELLAPPNDPKTFTAYLDKLYGRKEVKVNSKRLTGADLARQHPTKTYVIRTANHVATVKGGKVRDTWDSSKKSGYIIWEVA
jgi:hypothetical protein